MLFSISAPTPAVSQPKGAHECIIPGVYAPGVFAAWPLMFGGVPLNQAASATPTVLQAGIGQLFSGSGAVLKSAAPMGCGQVQVMTYIIYCKLKSSNPGATGDFFRSDGSFTVQNTGTNKVAVAYWNASDSGLNYWATSSAITWDGRYTVIIATGGPAWNSGTPKLWIDGALQSLTKSVGTPAGTNIAAPSKVQAIGGSESDTEWLNGSTIFYAIPVLRELTANEIALYSYRPWAAFKAPSKVKAGVFIAGATVPYWAFARRRSRVIGSGVH